MRRVRFRTLGCYPLTGAIDSDADTLDAIIAEMRAATTSERQGRLIDHDEVGLDGKEEARGIFLRTWTPPRREGAPPTLRLLTCGSVDDGKSTLIGRLLYEQKLIFDDQLAALERDSKKHGTVGEEIDFALLVDGLEAEREQGITIDVAYRYFATPRRSFIVADTPGHEQYTRNMATGASNADLAILLVDARKGLLTQTHRHAIIASLLGIRHVVLAVNKIDLVGFDEATFRRHRRRVRGVRRTARLPIDRRDSRSRPATATTSPRKPSARPGTTGRRSSIISNASKSRRTAGRRRSACRCNGSTGRIWISAASPARSPSGGIRRGDAIVVASSGRQSVVAKHPRRRPRGGRSAGRRGGDADARRRDRHRARRRAGARPTAARRSPTSSPRISSG